MAERASLNWYLRPLGALGILTVEYLTITFGFDAEPLRDRAGPWAGLGWMGLLAPAVIAFGTALWILSGAKLRAAFAPSASTTHDARRLLPALAVHLVCFAGFFAVTILVWAAAYFPRSVDKIPPALIDQQTRLEQQCIT